MPKYRKRRGHDTWHWYPTCDNWPTIDYIEMEEGFSPNTRVLCNMCLAIETAAHLGRPQMSPSRPVEGNSKDEIPSEIVEKYESIELIKRQERNKYVIYYLALIGGLAILYLTDITLNILLPLGVGTGLIIPSILDSVKQQDKLFFKLYKSIETLKLSESDSFKIAYKYFNDSMKILTITEKYNFPWNSENDEINVRFVNNLKSLVSPAILEGLITYQYLSRIALAFIQSNINDINFLNDEITAKLGKISFKSPEADKGIKNIFLSYVTLIISSTIIKFTLSIIGGYLTAQVMGYIITFTTGNELKPDTIMMTSAAFSIPVAYAVSLTKEKIFSIREDKRPDLKWTKER